MKTHLHVIVVFSHVIVVVILWIKTIEQNIVLKYSANHVYCRRPGPGHLLN